MADEETLLFIKDMLGYTDEQWQTWNSFPQNHKIAENILDVVNYKIVAEVISSYGCGVGHKVGDRIVYGANGALMCKENPDQVCFGLMAPVNPLVGAVMDKICLGEDPTQMAFNRVHCQDVGVDHGGWGEVVVEVKAVKVTE